MVQSSCHEVKIKCKKRAYKKWKQQALDAKKDAKKEKLAELEKITQARRKKIVNLADIVEEDEDE